MKYLLIFFAIFAVVIIVIAISFASGVISVLPKEIGEYGQLGDFFGGTLNPIFAFFAFLTLLYTVYLQSETLKVSRKELLATKEELEKSRIAQEEQSDSLKLQNEATKLQIFENTFFKLTELFLGIRKSISFFLIDKEIDVYDDVAIKELLSFFKDDNFINRDTFDECAEIVLGRYFEQIYQILKFINESNIQNKQRYVNIFRVQFTKDESEFLFYHCLGTIGKSKFKKLVEDYEFFEHIILNQDIEKKLLEYDIKAFGENENILKIYDELKEKAKTEEIPAFVKAE